MYMESLLKHVRTIAIVGLSDNPHRPSFQVASYLQSKGFTIIPINPQVNEVLGEQSYPDLLSVPQHISIDVIDIFRRPEHVLSHVKEAIKRGDVKTIWMQEGIEDEASEKLAKTHGLHVVMNFCLMEAHKKTYFCVQ